jgi:hypothetical protein
MNLAFLSLCAQSENNEGGGSDSVVKFSWITENYLYIYSESKFYHRKMLMKESFGKSLCEVFGYEIYYKIDCMHAVEVMFPPNGCIVNICVVSHGDIYENIQLKCSDIFEMCFNSFAFLFCNDN